MAKKPLPEIDFIRKRITYNPKTGTLTWLERPASDFKSGGKITAETRCKMWNNRHAGKPACATSNADGYLIGHVGGTLLLSHRVAFAIMEGRWPELVDHRNGDPADNRWKNLRETDKTGNAKNCFVTRRNKFGRTGVRVGRRGGFTAYIKREGQDCYLGWYETLPEAKAARSSAERVLGYSSRHGQIAPDI